MNELLSQFKLILKNADTSPNYIRLISETFIKFINMNYNIIDDLLVLIKFYFVDNQKYRINFLILINDLVLLLQNDRHKSINIDNTEKTDNLDNKTTSINNDNDNKSVLTFENYVFVKIISLFKSYLMCIDFKYLDDNVLKKETEKTINLLIDKNIVQNTNDSNELKVLYSGKINTIIENVNIKDKNSFYYSLLNKLVCSNKLDCSLSLVDYCNNYKAYNNDKLKVNSQYKNKLEVFYNEELSQQINLYKNQVNLLSEIEELLKSC